MTGMPQASSAVAVGAVAFHDGDDEELPSRPYPGQYTARDIFFMDGLVAIYEDLAMYRRYGYHPIVLGDVLPKPGTCESDKSKAPRYRVMYKLGFGQSSTVWLARDLLECRYVALKVCCGIDKPKFGRQTSILSHIQQTAKSQPGFCNILTLYESFIISGPNGFHECLVTDVLLVDDDRPTIWSEQGVFRQTSSAVSLLHSHGIAHGDTPTGELADKSTSNADLRPESFGIGVPGLQEISEEKFMESFLENTGTKVIPVFPRDPNFPRETIPAYLFPSGDVASILYEQGRYPEPLSATIKLLSFGEAFSTDRPPRHLLRVPSPPEVLVYHETGGKAGRLWSKEADVWALASMTNPFLVTQRNFFKGLYEPLTHVLYLGGPPPKSWFDHLDWEKLCSATTDRFSDAPKFSSVDHLVTWMAERSIERWDYFIKEDGFLDSLQQECETLIKEMMKTDPDARLDIAGVLAHPYFKSQCDPIQKQVTTEPGARVDLAGLVAETVASDPWQ